MKLRKLLLLGKSLFLFAFLLFAVPSFAQTTGGITIPAPSTGNGQFIQSNGSGLVLSSAVALTPGQGILYTVTDTLTAAQILAANVTPVDIVAAQSGKIIVPVAVVWKGLTTGHTPYSSTGFFWVGNTNDFILATGNASVLTQASDQVEIDGLRSTKEDAATSFIGVALSIGSSGAFTGGDAEMIVTCSYYIQ